MPQNNTIPPDICPVMYTLDMKRGKKSTGDQKIQWCSVTPVFPKEAYLTIVMFADRNTLKLTAIYPLETIDEQLESVCAYARDVVPKLEEGNPDYVAMRTITVFPLVFDRNYPLRREFWESPDVDFSPSSRVNQFAKISKLPEAYDVLVTPSGKTKRVWILRAATAFLKNTSDAAIEQFMLHSNWPVMQTAKYAAIYHLQKPIFLDWETGTPVT